MESKTLAKASDIISGERQSQYGSPENSFEIIADFWTVYLRHRGFSDVQLTGLDIAHMMSLLKHARMLGQQVNIDNYIDAAGYLAIAGDRLIDVEENEEHCDDYVHFSVKNGEK